MNDQVQQAAQIPSANNQLKQQAPDSSGKEGAAQQAGQPSTANGSGMTTTASTTEDDLNQISLTIQMPDFGSINLDDIQLPASCTIDDVKKFEELYKQHCEKILDLVVALKLNTIQNLWMRFWRSSEASLIETPENQSFYEEQLSSERFFALCECTRVYEFVTQCDFQFYQFCIEILIPDVFGMLPHTLVTLIRNLSKSIESWLVKALQNVPEKIRTAKISIIRAFSMTLKRYTSLSHLIQTVKNSLQNEGLLVHMSTDINKVDFSYIRVRSFLTRTDNKAY